MSFLDEIIKLLRNNDSTMLIANDILTSIDLNYHSIGAIGARALAEALKENRTLTNLEIRLNNIGPKGAQALAEMLSQNNTLVNLDLLGNSIGSDGTQALADALSKNHTLASIGLWDNNIGPKGAQALADALKVNQTLTSLNLNFNNIGPKGAQALADALEVNMALTKLAVCYKNSRIKNLLKRNSLIAKYPEFKDLLMTNCCFTQPRSDKEDNALFLSNTVTTKKTIKYNDLDNPQPSTSLKKVLPEEMVDYIIRFKVVLKDHINDSPEKEMVNRFFARTPSLLPQDKTVNQQMHALLS